MSKSNIDLSIIITAHREGIIAHKTILSLLKNTDKLEEQSVSYEIIIGLDNPDQATEKYFGRWKEDKRFRIIPGSFGNPADNRNNAIKHANGRYLSILDGDDLISRNWLLESLNILRKSGKPIIVRPNAQIMFGFDEPNIALWIMQESYSLAEDTLIMIQYNRWCSALMTTKEVLQSIAYKPGVDGFGYEDFLWNCDSRILGIESVIAPRTVIFYRRRKSSVSNEHIGAVLGRTKLFDTSNIKSINTPHFHSNQKSIKARAAKVARRTYHILWKATRDIKALERLIKPIMRNLLFKRNSKRISPWIIDSWREINDIENQLYPTKSAIANLQLHPLCINAHDALLGQRYQQLVSTITNNPDYLFLVPELSGRGGTEKLVGNYITAIKEAHPDWQISILSTIPFSDAVIKCPFFPKGVDMIDFGSITHDLSDEQKEILWSRILIQTGLKRLHIVNDDYWYRWVRSHQQLLGGNNFKVNISLFMREFTEEPDRVWSFADPDLMEVWPVVNKVFTDNRHVITESLENNAFDPDRMIVHYQPISIENMTKPKIVKADDRPLKILWASRLSRQKRPDILKAISARLDSKQFIIDVYGHLQHYDEKFFRGTSMNYKGSFSGGLQNLPTQEYDLYLYTSDTDGMPNILLEATSLGLPVVASNAGGIRELISDKKTGRLIDIDDIQGYVDAIKDIKSSPQSAYNYATAAQEILKKQHSQKRFNAQVAKDID